MLVWEEIFQLNYQFSAQFHRHSIALFKPDGDSLWLNAQVDHVALASNFGLGVFDDGAIELAGIDLG